MRTVREMSALCAAEQNIQMPADIVIYLLAKGFITIDYGWCLTEKGKHRKSRLGEDNAKGCAIDVSSEEPLKGLDGLVLADAALKDRP